MASSTRAITLAGSRVILGPSLNLSIVTIWPTLISAGRSSVPSGKTTLIGYCCLLILELIGVTITVGENLFPILF
jgi:hypothetical protein